MERRGKGRIFFAIAIAPWSIVGTKFGKIKLKINIDFTESYFYLGKSDTMIALLNP